MADGKWVWVPEKKPESGAGCIIFLIVLAIALIVLLISILLLPILSMIYSFFAPSDNRWKISIFSIIAYMYFLIDLNKEWISGFLFYGYESDGNIKEPLFTDLSILEYFHWANGIAIGIAVIWIVLAIKNR